MHEITPVRKRKAITPVYMILGQTFFGLAGLRKTITHDDHLLAAASAIFDGLLAEFVKEEQPNE